MTPSGDTLRSIKTFPQLLKYLRTELAWPIESDDIEDSTYDYTAEELGIDSSNAAKIDYIKQLMPLKANQPWGIFFVKFEKKQLPVVALRRILRSLVIKKRASGSAAERAAWKLNDLLFISAYGEGPERQMSLAHFCEPPEERTGDLPALHVLGWDDQDTVLHLDHAEQTLQEKLRWPDDIENVDEWRKQWSEAFPLKHREVISTSKDLAIHLADLAKRIHNRVLLVLNVEVEKGPLSKLHKAFRESLIHDLSEADFADMYAQTITYGLFSAACARANSVDSNVVAENLADMIPMTNPFLKEMLSTFLIAGGRHDSIDWDELGIQEVVDLLNSPNTHMDAVLRDFGNKTQQEDPVIHFYENFLSEYDKEKKVQRGVFYTPQPVVSYIVRSVHELLQKDFGLEDGLADTITWGKFVKTHPEIKIPEGTDKKEPFVQILDPATGTATFLVEVIEVIFTHLNAQWTKVNLSDTSKFKKWQVYINEHLLPRLFGYELMMAPYTIAHMKIGLKLRETCTRLGQFGYMMHFKTRANIFLTNSLEPPQDFSERLAFDAPALAHEAAAVNAVKRQKCFTVIIGNPPYSAKSKNNSGFITNLLAVYRKGLNERKPQLNDDYVKFIRLGHWLLSRGQGVFGMITNNSYLYGVTQRVMRNSFMADFDLLKVIDLGGDPNFPIANSIDDNVFDGITQGVGILLASRSTLHNDCEVKYSRLVGSRQTKDSLLAAAGFNDLPYKLLSMKENQPWIPGDTCKTSEYHTWCRVVDIFKQYVNGIVTSRDAFAVSESKHDLQLRLADFASMSPGELMKRYKRFDLRDNTSVKLADGKKGISDYQSLEVITQRCSYRPFDCRYVLYDANLIHRTRGEVMRSLLSDNKALVFNRNIRGDVFNHVFASEHVTMKEYLSSKDNCFVAPLFINGDKDLYESKEASCVNIQTDFFRRFLSAWNVEQEPYRDRANSIMMYIYAIMHSPSYRRRYDLHLVRDFPRIPITHHAALLSSLVKLGSRLFSAHLMEATTRDAEYSGYTGDPECEITRVGWSDNTIWINSIHNLTKKQDPGYISDKPGNAGFVNVPENVWRFRIGGYQVCYKWLSGRKGRVLSDDDIEHYQRIIIAISETIRIMGEIDEVIEKYGGWPDAFMTEPLVGENKVVEYPELELQDRKVAEKPKKKRNPPPQIVDDL